MGIRRLCLVPVVLIVLSSFCFAGGVAVGVKAGTLGLGAELTLGVSESLNLRVGANAMTLDLSSIIEDDPDNDQVEDIRLDLEFQTFAALLDWHPWGSGTGFRLTGGAMLNNNEVAASADMNKLVEIGDNEYLVSAFDGKVSFSEVSPYAGIGYGNAVDKDARWTFALDIGLLFQGSPDVELRATASNSSLQDILNADLDKEADEVEEDIKAINVYPVLSIGFARRF